MMAMSVRPSPLKSAARGEPVAQSSFTTSGPSKRRGVAQKAVEAMTKAAHLAAAIGVENLFEKRVDRKECGFTTRLAK
jgi:hypothetical protein